VGCSADLIERAQRTTFIEASAARDFRNPVRFSHAVHFPHAVL
jgi:hypothetical protein